MAAHPTSDDPSKYRVSAEVETWKLRDPILRFKAYLAREGKADAAYFAAIDAEADEMATYVRSGCLAMPDPPGTLMFDHVYAEPHAQLAAQRAEFVAYQAGFEGAH